METTKQNRRQFWVGMGVSLLCLVLIFVFIDPREIIDALRGADYILLGWAALGILLFMIIRAIRWRFLLRSEVGYTQLFHIQNIGYMLNMYLPARLGDVARAILIGSVPPITIAQGISTMVVERLLDMMFIVALLPFTLVTVDTLPPAIRQGALGIGIIAVIGIMFLIVAANLRTFFTRLANKIFSWIASFDAEKWTRRANRIIRKIFTIIPFLDKEKWTQRLTKIFQKIFNLITNLDVEAWTRRVDDMLKGLDSLTRLKDGIILIILSIAVWLPIIFAYHMSLQAVGLNVSVGMTAFVVCAAALSIAAPSSPGGVGVFQAGVIAALQILGQPEAESASFAFAYHATNYLVLTILGIIGLARTGSTFRSVIDTTQNYLKREKTP